MRIFLSFRTLDVILNVMETVNMISTADAAAKVIITVATINVGAKTLEPCQL